jgi:hypothetical protein
MKGKKQTKVTIPDMDWDELKREVDKLYNEKCRLEQEVKRLKEEARTDPTVDLVAMMHKGNSMMNTVIVGIQLLQVLWGMRGIFL